MSLEKEIVALTKAITTLNETLEAQSLPPHVKEKKAKEEEAKEEKAPVKKAAKKAPAKKAAKKEEPEEAEENIHDDVYYTDTVQPLTKKAAGELGREVVKSIIDEFGTDLKSAKDLEKDQWEDYVGRLNAELENAAEDDLS